MPRQPVRYEAEEPAPRQPDMFDWTERLRAQFGRFTWDFGGVLLIAISLMTLLALARLTGGIVLLAWAAILRLGLGWGSYLVVVGTAFAGLISSMTPSEKGTEELERIRSEKGMKAFIEARDKPFKE